MRIRKFILTFVIVWSYILVNAQYNNGFRNYKEEEIKRWKAGLSWSFIETDQKPLYILDGFGGWSGTRIPIPQTLNIERRWDPHFRLNLGIGYSCFQSRSVFTYDYQELKESGSITIQTSDTSSVTITDDGSSKTKKGKYVEYGDPSTYFGIDVNFLYNFRAFKHWYNLSETWNLKNLHKEKLYFDGYFIAGLGLYNKAAFPTLNTGVGGDFWITYKWGVNFQSMAKWSFNDNYRFHMQHQFGVVYHVDQGNDAGALGALRRRNKKHKKPKPVINEPAPVNDTEGGGSGDDFEDF